MSNRDLFGTDGVRGLAGRYPLDDAGARRIGMAIGSYFAKPGQTVVMAHDPRESSPRLAANVKAGLNAVGANVVMAGVLPTPGLAYITRENGDFVAGVMITASHNPVEYNGVKAFDTHGDKLSDATEAKLNSLIEDGVPEQVSGSISERPELVQQYEDFLVSSAKGTKLTGLKVAIDSANGAGSNLAERVFKRLGAEVTPLFNLPDGHNINQDCGATDTKALAHTVTDKALMLGIALDGDADRIVMIDEQGREVKGDYIMYILAICNHLAGVVATVMSNQGFETSLNKRGIKVMRTAVGDRYVLEGLAETGYKLGGEQSGHIILPELLKTGDALLTAVQTVRAVTQSGKSLAEWCDEVELLPQATVNISVDNKNLLEQTAVREFIKEQSDGLADGRLLIRPSGTEPLARIMVEAQDAQAQAERIAEELQQLLNKLSPERSLA